MYGMAQAVTDLIGRRAPAFDAAVPILSQLLKAEMAEREVRSIAYHMKAARFPTYKDISGYAFAASEINEATVRQLHRCEFIDGAQNSQKACRGIVEICHRRGSSSKESYCAHDEVNLSVR